jgi:polar amino acid transport system substrate-binding protein
MKLSGKTFGLTVCCLLLVPWTPQAASIKVHVESSEPWGFYLSASDQSIPHNRLSGIWIDIIRSLSETTRLPFETTLVPPARAVQNLENGITDLGFMIAVQPESKKVVPVAEMFTVTSIVVSLKKNRVQSYNDLYGKRIGVVRGIKLSPLFDDDFALFKQAYRNYGIIVPMLFQNRLDAIAGDAISLSYLMKKQGITDTYNHSFVLQQTSVWMLLSASSPQRDKINVLINANETLKINGEYQRILHKYSTYKM